MAETKINYPVAAATAITCTLASLADGGYRESAGVDNASNLYVDAQVSGSIQVGAVTADGEIGIYAYASADNGTVYSGGLVGTDETITWGTTPSTSSVEGFLQLALLDVVSVDTTDDNNDIEYVAKTTIAEAFGFMPRDWGVVILNDTGIAFHATGTNNVTQYTPVTFTTA